MLKNQKNIPVKMIVCEKRKCFWQGWFINKIRHKEVEESFFSSPPKLYQMKQVWKQER